MAEDGNGSDLIRTIANNLAEFTEPMAEITFRAKFTSAEIVRGRDRRLPIRQLPVGEKRNEIFIFFIFEK